MEENSENHNGDNRHMPRDPERSCCTAGITGPLARGVQGDRIVLSLHRSETLTFLIVSMDPPSPGTSELSKVTNKRDLSNQRWSITRPHWSCNNQLQHFSFGCRKEQTLLIYFKKRSQTVAIIPVKWCSYIQIVLSKLMLGKSKFSFYVLNLCPLPFVTSNFWRIKIKF
jgi:hypothetical protein